VTRNVESSVRFSCAASTGKAVNVVIFCTSELVLHLKQIQLLYATTANNMFFRFDPTNGTTTSVSLSGLAAGEHRWFRF
jgi:hypothetical protein